MLHTFQIFQTVGPLSRLRRVYLNYAVQLDLSVFLVSLPTVALLLCEEGRTVTVEELNGNVFACNHHEEKRPC